MPPNSPYVRLHNVVVISNMQYLRVLDINIIVTSYVGLFFYLFYLLNNTFEETTKRKQKIENTKDILFNVNN